jgi:ketosteroid isomerase-like protein
MRCIAVLLIALAACGGQAAKPATPTARAADRARQDAKEIVDEGYRALRSGDTDDLVTLLSEEVVVIGPRPADVMRSRADAVIALREVIDSRRKTKFAAAGLKLQLAAGGRSAYAVDRISVAGKAVVAAALLDGSTATWRVIAVALAAPVSAAAEKKATAAGTLSAPAATGEVPIGDGGAGPTQALASGLEDVGGWVGALPDDPEALLIGADGAVASGKKELERAARRWSDVTMEPSSAIASVVTADGKLAMVTCLAQKGQAEAKPEPKPEKGDGKGAKNAKASAKNGKAGKAPARPASRAAVVPHTVRVTAILRNAGGDTWQLAVFQEASAIAAK